LMSPFVSKSQRHEMPIAMLPLTAGM
jgi:hypothetical protein